MVFVFKFGLCSTVHPGERVPALYDVPFRLNEHDMLNCSGGRMAAEISIASEETATEVLTGRH